MAGSSQSGNASPLHCTRLNVPVSFPTNRNGSVNHLHSQLTHAGTHTHTHMQVPHHTHMHTGSQNPELFHVTMLLSCASCSPTSLQATVTEPGLKLLLEADNLPAHSEASQFETRRSARSYHSRKSTKRSASSYKALFGSADPLVKQRCALNPHLFDTPPMSNLEIAPKQDSRLGSRQEVRYSYGEVPELVVTTDVHEEVQEENMAEKIEIKEMKQSSSFFKWFGFRKKREPPESIKGGGVPEQKRLKKTKFHWGKKKASRKEAETNKVELSRQEESGEIRGHPAQKVAESKRLSAQEVHESEPLPAEEEVISAGDDYLEQSVTVPEVVPKQSMDICSLPNAPPLPSTEDGAAEASRRDPVGEEEPSTTPAGVSQSEEVTTNLSRNASSEKIVIREGRGSSRTPDNAVSIDFIKLRSIYHKRFSEFKDSDFPSPEGSDTEEGRTARHTGTRSFSFEQFGVEVTSGSQGPSPIPKNLEAEFEMSAGPSYEGDVSPLNESSLTDIAVPVEVDLNIDFNTKEILNISFHSKAGSPPASVTEQDSAAQMSDFKTPPAATPSMQPSVPEVITHIDDIPAGETPETVEADPVLHRQRSSVKNLAQMFESVGSTPSSTPLKRIPTPKKFAASGDVPTATPSEKDATPNRMASAGVTPTATPTGEDTTPKQVASSGVTPTATPTATPTGEDTTPKWFAPSGDTPTAKQVASSGDTPTATPTSEGTTPKWFAPSGDTPTATPSKGGTMLKRVASSGDVPTAMPTTGGTMPIRITSSGDTPIATLTKETAAPMKITSSGDTPTATPTIGSTTLIRITSSGDMPTSKETTSNEVASPVDTPTQMASEVTETDEGGDVLTPLKRISTASLRRSSATPVDRDQIDGIPPSDGERDDTHPKFVHTISPPSRAMLSAFVHSADSKHLSLVKFQHDLDQANLADRVAQDLLVVPTPSDETEARMQKHVLSGVLQPKVYIAKVCYGDCMLCL